MFKSTKKALMWTTVSIGLFAGSGFAAFAYIEHWESKNVVSEKNVESPTEIKIGDVVNSNQNSVVSESVTDTEIQTIIHGMTHQKVQANAKWTFTEMSPKNIKRAIELVEKNKDILTHHDFYMEALRTWEKGDFFNCVEVHNQVWEWQGGTIGIATRLATAEEEKAYLESAN